MNKTANSNQVAGGIGFYGVLVIKKFKDGKLIWESAPMKNKVVSGSGGYGRNLVLRRLCGDTTYGFAIDSAAIGSGSTAPVDSDTGLETPVLSSITISNTGVANDVATIDVFISDGSLANGTYREFGFFIGAQLFSRILISPVYTKASGEDTTFTYTLTSTG